MQLMILIGHTSLFVYTIIYKVIEDIKEKANIHIEKFELEPMGLFPISISNAPIVISIVLAVIILYIFYPFF